MTGLAVVLAWLAAAAPGGDVSPARQQPAPPPAAQAGQAREATSVVRGTVVDAGSSRPIGDVRVALVEPGRSVRTPEDGRFEFRGLAAGRYTLTVSRIGYIFVHREVEIGADAVVDVLVPIAEGTGTYRENVTVTADATPARAAGVSSETALGSAALQDLRVVAADDPLRAVQALPGVATGDDFKAQFSVRGSAFRHVGFVLDGTATPLLLHAIRGLEDSGSIAMINTDVLSRASLSAGPHPLRHGDWIGATLEFETRDGSRDRASGRLAVSATSASTVLEGPIGATRRGSWLVSLRTSYLDWLVRKVEPTLDDALGFSDLHAKLVFDLGDRQQVQFLMVAGDATYRQDNATGLNTVARANSQSVLLSGAWRYIRERSVLSQRVSVVRNTFDDQARQGQDLGRGRARTVFWRGDGVWTVSPRWSFEGGLKVESQRAEDVHRLFQAVDSRIQIRAERRLDAQTTVASAWAQFARTAGAFQLVGGLRLTHDTLDRRTLTSPWLLAERRAGAFTVRASASTAAQIPEIELRRAIPGLSLQPECATFADVGIEHQLTPATRWQITAFARDEWHVLRRTGEDRLVDGERVREDPFATRSGGLHGLAKGFDVVLERRAATGLTGWIGYTYLWLRHEDRDSGETFPGDFDQRHTLNIFGQYRLSYRTTLSAKLRIGTNVPLAGYYEGTVDEVRLAAARNRLRLPLYARLDVRANRTFTFDRRRLTLFVELMNALDHENLSQSNGSVRQTLQVTGLFQKLIPRVPSAGILIEF
jgi:hypothetical protein